MKGLGIARAARMLAIQTVSMETDSITMEPEIRVQDHRASRCAHPPTRVGARR